MVKRSCIGSLSVEELEIGDNEFLLKSIRILNIPYYVADSLHNVGIFLIGKLVQKTADQLIFPYFGDKDIEDINSSLAELNLHLGMKISNWLEPHTKSCMTPQRVLEITKIYLNWRWNFLLTERYMGELKACAEDSGIDDKEMFEFFKTIHEIGDNNGHENSQTNISSMARHTDK